MGKYLTFILGGARSGKSSYAQNLAEQRASQPDNGSTPSGFKVLFVATAIPFDDEMRARIAKHQSERPASWRTLEAPQTVGAAIGAYPEPPAILLLDCLTLLANNILLGLPDIENSAAAQSALDAEMDSLLSVYAKSTAEWIVVSNEVGLGLVPPYPLGRIYRDVLGRANQRLAQAADKVIFMVAGIPMIVK
jgi:adenosylcobinamide kinase / adenosylcobinamide-phosphate guanylyltransferase